METQVEVHGFMMSNNVISNDTGHDSAVITKNTSEILNDHNPTTSQQHDQDMI